MRWRSVMSLLRTGCSPTWNATSSTASIANIVFLLSRGMGGPLTPSLALRRLRFHAGGSESTGAPGRLVELGNLPPDRPGVPRHDQLCNSHAAGDAKRLGAQIDEDYAHFAAIVGVDRARRVGHGDAVLGGQPGPWADLGLEAHRQGDRDAGRHDLPLQRSQLDLALDRGQQVGAGRRHGGVVGQRQIVTVRQANDLDVDGLCAHSAASAGRGRVRCKAIAPASCMATLSFGKVGQACTPSAVIRWTVLRSPPNVPVAGETSLATIQSQPLRLRFSMALATTFSVSAAKPTTSVGRTGPRFESVARMSGLGVSSSAGGAAPGFFLILADAGLAIFQSATAAAHTATSTLPASRQAASIWSAESIFTTVTPAGSGTLTGPLTSVTSAPSCASAAAIAWPCLPDEWLEM